MCEATTGCTYGPAPEGTVYVLIRAFCKSLLLHTTHVRQPLCCEGINLTQCGYEQLNLRLCVGGGACTNSCTWQRGGAWRFGSNGPRQCPTPWGFARV
jgi:hypothetical protein